MSTPPVEAGGLSAQNLLDEVTRRQGEAARLTDFQLVRHLLTHAVGASAIGSEPIELSDGVTAHPLDSSLPSVSTPDVLTVEDGKLQIPIDVSRPATAHATFVSVQAAGEYAEVHEVEAELPIPEKTTMTAPFGVVAKDVIEGSHIVDGKMPGEGDTVYGINGFLNYIEYSVPMGTTVSYTFTEPGAEGGQRIANIRFNGPLNVYNPMVYVKVAGNTVLKSSQRRTQEPLLVDFPEDLSSFEINVPQDCERIVPFDGCLVGIRRGSPVSTEMITSLAELQDQIDQLGSTDADHFTFLNFTGFSGLPEMDMRAHRAVADAQGWEDDTSRFLLAHPYEFKQKAADIVTERIRILGREATIGALDQSIANEDAQPTGASNVSIYLRDRILEARKNA